jgi:hypothetical protein
MTKGAGAALALRTDNELDRALSLAIARQCLAEADSLPEISDLIDRAEIVRVAARKAKLSASAQNDWAEYKLDAERKAGTELKRMYDAGERSRGNRGNLQVRLEDLGVSYYQCDTWQRVAELPENEYEQYKKDARDGGEITEAGALRAARVYRKAQLPTPDINTFVSNLAKSLLKKLDKSLSTDELDKLVQYRKHVSPFHKQELVAVLRHIAMVAGKYAAQLERG